MVGELDEKELRVLRRRMERWDKLSRSERSAWHRNRDDEDRKATEFMLVSAGILKSKRKVPRNEQRTLERRKLAVGEIQQRRRGGV
jgi:hypothetical protein